MIHPVCWAFQESLGKGATVYGALARSGGVSSSTISSIQSLTGNQVTIAFWARPLVESGGGSILTVSDSASAAGNRIFSSHLEWTNGFTYWDAAWNASNLNRVSVNLGSVSDAYHHYIYTYDGDAKVMQLFKDNVLVASNSSIPGGAIAWSSIMNFELAAQSFESGAGDAEMDEFALWTNVLNSTERAILFSQGVLAVPEPGVTLLGLAGLGMLGRRRVRRG